MPFELVYVRKPGEADDAPVVLNENAIITDFPANLLPNFRLALAKQKGCDRNLIFEVWGGIGDQMCAEPTIRYAVETFKGYEISVATPEPDLLRHLPLKRLFDKRIESPIWENYSGFQTIYPQNHIAWQFYNHMLMHPVDYSSIACFRMQLPIDCRTPRAIPTAAQRERVRSLLAADGGRIDDVVVFHAGKHWQVKTFPAEWWNAVLHETRRRGVTPVLIGSECDDNRGTVDVDDRGCIDMRGRLSLIETIALLQDARVLLTNDSAPLHLAATGDAWIGFVPTVKHPDYLYHWRHSRWGWRMQAHCRGGAWEVWDNAPRPEDLNVERVEPDLLASWLPDPQAFAQWGVDRLRNGEAYLSSPPYPERRRDEPS